MKKRVSPTLKVRTSLSLSKTKPVKASTFSSLRKKLIPAKPEKKPETSVKTYTRVQPESQIAKEAKMNLWFVPARLAFFFNGLYFLGFAVMGLLGVFSNYKIIQPFFTLPFDNNFSSFFLLEIASVFALMASLIFFHSAHHPKTYRWFYFFLILVFLPYHFLSNLQKMQIELPQNFQNYLYFDTIVVAVFWGAYLLSLYPYLKTFSRKP